MSLVTTIISLMIAALIAVIVVLPLARDAITPWINDSNHSEGRTTAFSGTLQTIVSPIPILLGVVILVAIATAMG